MSGGRTGGAVSNRPEAGGGWAAGRKGRRAAGAGEAARGRRTREISEFPRGESSLCTFFNSPTPLNHVVDPTMKTFSCLAAAGLFATASATVLGPGSAPRCFVTADGETRVEFTDKSLNYPKSEMT